MQNSVAAASPIKSPHTAWTGVGVLLLIQSNLHNQPYAGHAYELFKQLGKSGDTRFFQSVIVSVDAGVDSRQRNGQGHDVKQSGAVGIVHHYMAEPFCFGADQNHAGQGQENGYGKSRGKVPFCLAAVGCACGKTGDGSLESCRRDGENQGKRDGKIECCEMAQPFCTNCSGKEYFIVETDESADDSRGGQEQSA